MDSKTTTNTIKARERNGKKTRKKRNRYYATDPSCRFFLGGKAEIMILAAEMISERAKDLGFYSKVDQSNSSDSVYIMIGKTIDLDDKFVAVRISDHRVYLTDFRMSFHKKVIKVTGTPSIKKIEKAVESLIRFAYGSKKPKHKKTVTKEEVVDFLLSMSEAEREGFLAENGLIQSV
jgi:hypothetical protein